jgi:hypothetical protein
MIIATGATLFIAHQAVSTAADAAFALLLVSMPLFCSDLANLGHRCLPALFYLSRELMLSVKGLVSSVVSRVVSGKPCFSVIFYRDDLSWVTVISITFLVMLWLLNAVFGLSI